MTGNTAESVAEELREDPRVESASAEENEKGEFVRVVAKDRLAGRDIKTERSKYNIFVRVVV